MLQFILSKNELPWLHITYGSNYSNYVDEEN